MQFYYDIKWEAKFLTEAKFTTALLKKVREDGWAYKLPDVAETIKPFDFFAVNKSWIYFAEVKMIDWNVFDFSELRDNQYTALKRVTILKERFSLDQLNAVLIVYSKKYKLYKVVPFRKVLEEEKKWRDELRFLF